MRCRLKFYHFWHHKACRVMPDSYSELQNFQFALNSHNGFFFLHTHPSTTAFKLKYVLCLQFYAKTIFSIKKCSVWLLSIMLTSKHLVENYAKTDVKKMSWRRERVSSFAPMQDDISLHQKLSHGNSNQICKKHVGWYWLFHCFLPFLSWVLFP